MFLPPTILLNVSHMYSYTCAGNHICVCVCVSVSRQKLHLFMYIIYHVLPTPLFPPFFHSHSLLPFFHSQPTHFHFNKRKSRVCCAFVVVFFFFLQHTTLQHTHGLCSIGVMSKKGVAFLCVCKWGGGGGFNT